jgi:hypothetical protein
MATPKNMLSNEARVRISLYLQRGTKHAPIRKIPAWHAGSTPPIIQAPLDFENIYRFGAMRAAPPAQAQSPTIKKCLVCFYALPVEICRHRHFSDPPSRTRSRVGV